MVDRIQGACPTGQVEEPSDGVLISRWVATQTGWAVPDIGFTACVDPDDAGIKAGVVVLPAVALESLIAGGTARAGLAAVEAGAVELAATTTTPARVFVMTRAEALLASARNLIRPGDVIYLTEEVAQISPWASSLLSSALLAMGIHRLAGDENIVEINWDLIQNDDLDPAARQDLWDLLIEIDDAVEGGDIDPEDPWEGVKEIVEGSGYEITEEGPDTLTFRIRDIEFVMDIEFQVTVVSEGDDDGED